MGIGAVSAGLSGLQAAEIRQRNSAHNVANFLTGGFRNHRTSQVSRDGGGTKTRTRIDPEPRPVSLAGEFVQQKLASIQLEASARVIDAALDTERRLLDIFA